MPEHATQLLLLLQNTGVTGTLTLVKDRLPFFTLTNPFPFWLKAHLALTLFFPLSSRGFFSVKLHYSITL